MAACVAFNCTNNCAKKIPGLTFHSFPKDETRRKLWVIAVRRKNWKPSKFSKLCSKHFPEEMFDRTSLSYVRLRDNAVPSIFDFPCHVQKVIKLRKLPIRKVFEPADSNIEVQPSTSVVEPADSKIKVEPLTSVVETADSKIKVEPSTNGVAPTELEIVGSSSESPTEATYKRKVAELGNIIEEKNKKIKVLQQKIRRYEKKFKFCQK